jgi:plastocyanin
MRRGGLPAAAVVAGVLVLAPSASAATKLVVAGPPVADRPAGVPPDADSNQFFRKTITIHKGDRVQWRFAGFHSVTFPKLGDQPPPFIIPQTGSDISGALDPDNKPFWFNGQPNVILNPQGANVQGGSSYNGKRLTGSGVPADEGEPRPYTLSFNKTGSFKYYCVVHPGQRGTVKVVPSNKSVPTRAEDRRAVQQQFTDVVDTIRKDANFDGPSGNAVEAGNDTISTTFLRFFPQSKTVKVGDVVTFKMSKQTTEIHTVTFGPEAFLQNLAQTFLLPEEGSGNPPTIQVSPISAYPSDPPPVLPAYNGVNHGNGFINTGFLDRIKASESPGYSRIKFTNPGTYGYFCVIHPNMTGQIVVAP